MGHNPKGIDGHASKGPTGSRNQGRDKAKRRKKKERMKHLEQKREPRK